MQKRFAIVFLANYWLSMLFEALVVSCMLNFGWFADMGATSLKEMLIKVTTLQHLLHLFTFVSHMHSNYCKMDVLQYNQVAMCMSYAHYGHLM